MKIVAVSGSLRSESSNRFLLRAASRVAPKGTDVVFYEEVAGLPHFNPDLDEEGAEPPRAVRELRQAFIAADALLFSSPEYAHGVPGSFKNMLDWLVSTGELVDKPVALLNASPSGGSYAQSQLLETLRTMNWNVVATASRLTPFLPRRLAGDVEDDQTLKVLAECMAELLRVASQ